jgi:hypothetical protein
MRDQPHARDTDNQSEIKTGLGQACGAKTRAGGRCRSLAMPNGRCRMHGGPSPGAPKGEKNGNWRHGGWTATAQAERRRLRALLIELRELALTGGSSQ